MGDVNQWHFIRQRAARLRGPYLEVGARDYGTTQDLRSLFAGSGDYLGVDLSAGPGVDQVLDLAGPLETVEAALGGRRFGTIFCLSVLEHVEQPFRMAENLTHLLAPGGHLCVGVPFAFKIHGYPSDYWRFTPDGVRRLFAEIDFPPEDSVASTLPGEFQPLDDQLGRLDLASKVHRRQGHILRGLSAGTLRLLGRVGLLRWLTGHRYVLAPTMILMLGVRRRV